MRVPQVSERIKEAPAQALRGVFAGIGQLLLITDKLRNKVAPGQDVRRAPAPRAAETVTDTTAADPAGPREEVAAAGEPAAASASASAAASAGAPAAAEGAPAEAVAAEPAPATPPAARRAPAKPAGAKPAGAKPAAARRASPRRAAPKPSAVEPDVTEAPTPPKRQGIRDFDKTGNVRVLGDAEGFVAPIGAPEPVAAAEPAAAIEPVAAPQPVAAQEPAAAPEPISAEQASVAAGEAASSPADSGTPLPNYDELSVASLRARLRNLDAAQVGRLADYERAHAARADVLAMYERRIAKLEAEA